MTYVTLDGLHMFAADYAEPGMWNGFAVVGFTRAQADILATHFAAENTQHPDAYDTITWDEERQAYRLENSAYPDDAQHITANADGLYLLGAYEWVWTVPEDDVERLEALGLAILHD